MTTISPLLQSKLNNNSNKPQMANNRHEKIYEDLQKRAHEAKPNEAKAQIVKQGILGDPIAATKDTFKDGANFFKAVHTGNMGDNNLGRINDLGLKIGAGLIATFLALHSKTKTESIMRFIGGGTFIAAMSLWPKLFINIPARLVHGFRIDDKYISAQGDKKDFFLDNQFLVWDAYPEEQLRKNAARAGIDYDSKNGKEKIQRKMQKTALQNRTLWMGTAGFATPLLTSMIGNFVEPLVKKGVVNHEYKKVEKMTQGGIPEYIKGLTPQKADNKAIDVLISEYKDKALDDEFFTKLSKTLVGDGFLGRFKDSDDMKVFEGHNSYQLAETLQNLRNDGTFSTFNEASLRNSLSQAFSSTVETNGSQGLGLMASALDNSELGGDAAKQAARLSEAQIQEIVDSLGGDFSFKKVKSVLEGSGIVDEDVKKILSSAEIDDSKFFDFVKRYNEGPLAQIRTRAKGYIDMINPVLGSKAESVYTSRYLETTGNLLKTFGFTHKELLELRAASPDEISRILATRISERVGKMDEAQYKTFIESLMAKNVEGLETLTTNLGNIENIKSITDGLELSGIDADQLKALNNAALGGSDETEGLLNLIRQFVKTKQIDYTSAESKAILCANFERRLLGGEFKDVLSEEDIKIARKILYDGTISTAKNRGYAANPKDANRIAEVIFDKTKFESEKTVLSRIGEIADDIKKIYISGRKGLPSEDYMACGSLADTIKKTATSLGNNKSWIKIFGPMTIALIAVTLLVQPLFGNIKKEFPEEKNGGAK
ncbi:hypothetical protein IJ425_08710 [bacterium]|nr:hypothetical protein [bacterium]